jgi:hypothetical protein
MPAIGARYRHNSRAAGFECAADDSNVAESDPAAIEAGSEGSPTTTPTKNIYFAVVDKP